jgi:PAS domain-containing protein
MTSESHHADLVKGIAEQMKTVLDKSPQAIYLYLDDNHKICNKKFADLVGYKSVKAWADVEAPLADVVEEDQQSVIDAYMKASEEMSASVVDVRVENIKTAEIVKTRMIIAPIGFAGHIFTAHYFTKI